MTVRWTVRAATGLASASCHANSVTEGLLRGCFAPQENGFPRLLRSLGMTRDGKPVPYFPLSTFHFPLSSFNCQLTTVRPKELSLRAAKAAWQSVPPAAIGGAVLRTARKRIPTTSLRTGLGMTRDGVPSPTFIYLEMMNWLRHELMINHHELNCKNCMRRSAIHVVKPQFMHLCNSCRQAIH